MEKSYVHDMELDAQEAFIKFGERWRGSIFEADSR